MHELERPGTGLYRRAALLRHPATRAALALAFTLVATVLLVQSSRHPYVGPPAPVGPPDLGRELLLTVGHVVVFSVLVVLWWWALLPRLAPSRALFVAVGFALVYGLLTELAQTAVADRSASLYDLAVNWSVTIGTGTLLTDRLRRRGPLPGIGPVVEDAGRVAAQPPGTGRAL